MKKCKIQRDIFRIREKHDRIAGEVMADDLPERQGSFAFLRTPSDTPANAPKSKAIDRFIVSWGKGSAFYFSNEREAAKCANELRAKGKRIRAITHTDLS